MSINANANRTIKILMTDNGLSPYSESAEGSLLSTINYAVRGRYFNVDQSYELKPSVVKNWQWDSKSNKYILTLDASLKFHDGTSPNAKDLEFSLLRGFFSEKRSFYEIYLGGIEGVDKADVKKGFRSGAVSGVKIVDNLTIEVKLSHPNPSFLFSLTRPYFSLTSERFYKKDLITWKEFPIGTGNYKVESEDDEKVVLSRSSNQAKFKNIYLYKKNIPEVEYDISYLDESIKDAQKSLSKDPVSISTVYFNQESVLSKNEDFRNAVYYLINKEKIVSFFEGSKVSHEFLPTNFWSSNSIKGEYNLIKAKKIAEKIPKELKEKVWKVPVFSTSTQLSERMLKTAGEIESQLMSIGIKVKFYASSHKFLPQDVAKESAFSFSSRICDNLDPLLMFGSFRTNSAYKYDNAQNDKAFDDLYMQAARAVSTEDRISTMRKISQYVTDNKFFVPILERKSVYYYNPKTIKSLGNQVSPITLDFDQIEMK